MKITFEPSARDELEHIFEWIAKDIPRAARAMVARIEEKVMRLEAPTLTHMGRPGLVPGTRELIEYPYLLSTEWTMNGAKSSWFPSYTAPVIGNESKKPCFDERGAHPTALRPPPHAKSEYPAPRG